MTDFNPPFAHAGERREPTQSEIDNGFPCGPASQLLFNELFYRLEGHIGEVINFAGVTPSAPLVGLREAIEALIAAATGGGDTSQFLLISQARARLPIFPDVQTSDGRIGVTSTGPGNVRLAGGVTFLHRGIFPVTTTQTDFVTDASKTYHLRWNPSDGFVLRDLASGTYNPGTLAESNAAFDSTYDDMLVARIVTNSSNVATITTLTNRARILLERVYPLQNTTSLISPAQGLQGRGFTISDAWNLSRTPIFTPIVTAARISHDPLHISDPTGASSDFRVHPLASSFAGYPTISERFDRYGTEWQVMIDNATAINIRAKLDA